jgi:hypothetical protein
MFLIRNMKEGPAESRDSMQIQSQREVAVGGCGRCTGWSCQGKGGIAPSKVHDGPVRTQVDKLWHGQNGDDVKV